MVVSTIIITSKSLLQPMQRMALSQLIGRGLKGWVLIGPWTRALPVRETALGGPRGRGVHGRRVHRGVQLMRTHG